MTMDLNILSLARDLGQHASARQALIAQNVANADTPGYQARDLTPFSEVHDGTADPFTLKTSRAGHMSETGPAARFEMVSTTAFGAEAPNGNTVSVEDQMMRAADVQQSHELALGVYRKSLDILRISMGAPR
ncbi:MAG: FlgB family protein [Pseudomonadota bacterium]